MDMRRARSFLKLALVASTCLLANCQSALPVPEPGLLVEADDEALARLKSAAALAMGKGRVEFGAVDLENSSQIPVLPPRPGPFEGQSPALPTYFDLAVQNGACLIIKRASGEAFKVEGVSCKPVGG